MGHDARLVPCLNVIPGPGHGKGHRRNHGWEQELPAFRNLLIGFRHRGKQRFSQQEDDNHDQDWPHDGHHPNLHRAQVHAEGTRNLIRAGSRRKDVPNELSGQSQHPSKDERDKRTDAKDRSELDKERGLLTPGSR